MWPGVVVKVRKTGCVTSLRVLQGLPFVSSDGKTLKQGTKLMMSTTPLGGFCVEVESPGTLAQQRTFFLADYTSKHLTYAMLDRFMGPNALDPVAQLDIGACFLYFANGFKFDEGTDDPRRIEESEELLQNRELYFHPAGVMMAPEGQTVPGMKDIPGEDDDEDSGGRNQLRQDLASSSGAASGGGGEVANPQTAALTLSRHNFSLPQLGRHSREASSEQQPQGMLFRPRDAFKGLLGHLGRLRLGGRDAN